MVTQLAPGVYSVGVKHPELKKFDIIMDTPGTTYNSYLVVGEKIALIDTVRREFGEELLANIRSVIDPAALDYIVVQHTEPDHSGSIPLILSHAPHAQILISPAGAKFLKQQLNGDFPHQVVTEQTRIDLGGKTLSFYSAPFLHWSDTMFTYLSEDRVLFSCDAFSLHYPETDQSLVPVEPYFTQYYEAIMAPFAPSIQKAVQKISDLPIDIVGTSHGPILTDNPREYIRRYEEMSRPIPAPPYAVVVFASAYGFTRKLAEALIGELKKSIEVKVFDLENDRHEEILTAIDSSQAVLIGSPTFNQDAIYPAWTLLAHLSPIINRGKPAGAFGSFGWSGEAVELLSQRLKGLKLNVLPGVRAQFNPTDDDLENIRQLGRDILTAVGR